MPYRNGVWLGQNLFAGDDGKVSISFPMSNGDASIYFEDGGLWPSFDPGSDPSYYALLHQQLTAQRFTIYWSAVPKLTPVRDDSQMSGISVTGALRNVNCQVDPLMPTRAVLTYSITTNGTSKEVRWWNKTTVVAFGSRVGDGSLVCDPVNGSGLHVTCTLAYSADIAPGVASLELRWPRAYHLHYADTALSFPRPSESIVNDNGGVSYSFATPLQTSSSIHYAVVPEDDEGNLYASPAEASDSPVVLINPPQPPSGLFLSGTAAAPVINWTPGESGCIFEVYRGLVNSPVNFGGLTTPAPIETGVDATSQALTAITDYAPFDRSTPYNALASAFDSAVSALHTAFIAGETGFAAAIETFSTALTTTLATFAANAYIRVNDIAQNVATLVASLRTAEARWGSGTASGWTIVPANYVAGETTFPLTGGTGDFVVDSIVTIDSNQYVVLDWDGATLTIGAGVAAALVSTTTYTVTVNPASTGDWQNQIGLVYMNVVASLGELLEHNPGRYIAPVLGVPPHVPRAQTSLLDLVTPFILPGTVTICVRAKKGGIEELSNQEITVQFDSAGNIQLPKPPDATVNPPLVFSAPLVCGINAGVVDDADHDIAAQLNLYVTPHGSAFDFSTPSAFAWLDITMMGYHEAVIPFTFASAGYWDFCVRASGWMGDLSDNYDVFTEYVSNDTPNAAGNVYSQVIRG